VTVKSGRHLIALLTLVAALLPSLALADDVDDVEDQGRLSAVQRRKFREAHELQIAFAALPLDAFYKGVGAEVGYTWHVTDRFAWEVVHGGYAADLDTGLKTQLQTDFGVAPTQFEVAKYYVNSNVVLKPLYMKASLFNRAVVHGELFFLGGGGIFSMTSGIKPSADVGLGGRLYLTPHISLRSDARENFVLLQNFNKTKNVITFSLGLSFDFGSD
jgi:outer membrane beta-barrel protein